MIQTANKIYPAEQAGNENASVLPLHLPRSSEFLLNRELSLMEFFKRVLDEGFDGTQPLLERLKFLAILSSVLDEYFTTRVSSFKETSDDAGVLTADGMTGADQLTAIRERFLQMIEMQTDCLHKDILPALAEQGILISSLDSLTDVERQDLSEYFKSKIYPLLTPQAVDSSHPFPYISGGSLNLGLMVKPKVIERVAKKLYQTDEAIFMRIKIPSFVERFVTVGDTTEKFVLVEDLICANVKMLLPEADAEACFPFRITRDADNSLKEMEIEDLLETMEANLNQRRFGDVVKLEISDAMPTEIAAYLTESLEISEEDVYVIKGALNISDFMALYKLERPDLKSEPLRVARPAVFKGQESTFDIIKRGDVLLHHPYHPYDVVTDFIAEAVEDPEVLAIKMCVYRTGANSPIPPLLIKASERGKQVTVLIELRARDDEEQNIEWAKRLEEAGIHVIYGLLGLKTHCKTTLIMRREGDDICRYVHIATGNYNPETAALYTDLGLLTNDKEIGEDAAEMFNFLSAYSQPDIFHKLLVSPINLRERMLGFIKRETANAKNGLPARIIAKMNRFADLEFTRALYEASQAGVEIDLIVRGICVLRPGVEGLSDNIRVRNIVGQLLEHSRVYYFENAGRPEIYLGSSDWMPRNLNRRVEVLTPIEDAELKRYLKDELLEAYLRDNVKAAGLLPDGSYEKVSAAAGEEIFNSQLSFQDRSPAFENDSNVVQFEPRH